MFPFTWFLPQNKAFTDVGKTVAGFYFRRGLEQNGLERNEDFSSNHWTQDKEKNAHVSGIGKNPWALRLQRKLEKKLQQENKNIIKRIFCQVYTM